MANALYNKARMKFLNAEIDWDNDSIYAALIDTTGASGGTYSADLAAHEFLSSIPADCIRSRTVLPNRSITADGSADSDDLTFTGVTYYTGASINAIVIYKNVGPDNDATSPLIAWIDTAQGFSIVPNGGDINVVWDGGINRIFRL